ncbi:hypothetical protein B0H17DRAFT_957045, partial [Mycena rosella]
CAECSETNPIYRCLHCFAPQFLCQDCMVVRHIHVPLHRIKVYLDGIQTRINLAALGMHIQLGHSVGQVCPYPECITDFLIVNAHGMHKVFLDYCSCPEAPSRGAQLHRARMFPIPEKSPNRAVAYEVAHLQDAWTAPISMKA